jgi:CBS domain-containing protein
VLSVIAPCLDPSVFTVGDLANDTPTTIDEKRGISDAIEQMRKSGVRRMPVVGPGGRLVGILAVDDLLQLLAEELGHIAALISREQERERRMRV